MIPIQPILVVILVLGVVLYFRKLRSKLWDRIIVVMLFAAATVFIMNPVAAAKIRYDSRLGVRADAAIVPCEGAGAPLHSVGPGAGLAAGGGQNE